MAGFEPARAFSAQRILSPLRLPFRHIGIFGHFTLVISHTKAFPQAPFLSRTWQMPSRFRTAHPIPAHCPFPSAADPNRMFSANSDTSATGMRTTATKIREITIEGKTFYEVQWPKFPKGCNRQAFRQKTEAGHFLKQKLAEQRNYGIAGSGFNLNQRVEYLECADNLAPSNATLRDANNERTC